jgi:hypothetical protein
VSSRVSPDSAEDSATGRPWLLGLLLRGPGGVASLTARIVITVLIVGGAACMLGSGVIHLYLWGKQYGYKDVPTIGPLFLIQGIAAILLGILLVVSRQVIVLLAGAGVFIASVVALVLAIEVGLFGFRDSWLAPYAWTTFYEEIAGAVLLLLAAAGLVWSPRGPRTPAPAVPDADARR